MNSFGWLGWVCCPALLAIGVACTFEDRRLHDFDTDPDELPSGVPPPSSGGSGMVLGGNGGASGTGSTVGLGNGGSSNPPLASGGSAGQVAASAGGSSAAPPLTGCARPGACTANGIPIGTGLSIVPDATGFVRGESNGLGIEGAVYSASDGGSQGNSVITLAFGSGGSFCLSGVIGQVLEDAQGLPEYARYWGALVGLTLAREPGSAQYTPLPWSPASPAGSVIGFRFTLSGPTIPAEGALRFSAVANEGAGPEYCTALTPASGVPTTVAFSGLRSQCYSPLDAVAMPANTPLETLHWSLLSNTESPVPFDFCISDLTAVVP